MVASISNRPPLVFAVNVVLGIVTAEPVTKLVLQQLTNGAEKFAALIHVSASTTTVPVTPCGPCAPCGPCGPIFPSHTYRVWFEASVMAAPPLGHVIAGASATVTL